MSRYLVDRLERTPNVAVRTQTEVVGAEGDGRLESLVLSERGVRPRSSTRRSARSGSPRSTPPEHDG
jgi:hypothetical protein